MLKDKSLTYISLFSSAGVGCYGFNQEGYHCILTNELIERRLDVQRYNHKCETYCITPEEKIARIGDYIRDVLGKD